jgi:hypothetical protein
VPFPSEVLLPDVVGSAEVDQHTPLAVTSAPPSDVTLPPDVAPVWVTAETLAVVTTGGVGFFLHDTEHTTEHNSTNANTGILDEGFIASGFN